MKLLLRRRPTARHVHRALPFLAAASTASRELGHNYIGTEHLLLALSRDYGSTPAQALLRLDISSDQIRTDIITRIGAGGRAGIRSRCPRANEGRMHSDLSPPEEGARANRSRSRRASPTSRARAARNSVGRGQRRSHDSRELRNHGRRPARGAGRPGSKPLTSCLDSRA